jgi:osmoprotectant transport system permease protein
VIELFAQLKIHERTGKSDCVERNGICPRWIVDNFDRYTHPFVQQLELVLLSVAIGFAIAFGLALLGHRHRRFIAPITQVTGILYTLPSVAVFFLLLPITGRGTGTALIALVAYTLLIIFRNEITGLEGVPEEARDAGSGMGLTARQLLWRVELPLALPEIMLGLNQTIMMALAMVVIASMIGVQGLGQPVLKAIANQYFTLGIFNGLAIVGIAIIFDRVSQAYGKRLQKHREIVHG